MSYEIVDTEPEFEPVTVAEAKAYMQIDADYASDDTDINIALGAARRRLEAYLNIGLAEREVTVYWNGRELELPLSPTGSITSVKQNDTVLESDKYTVLNLPAKKIYVNSVCGLTGHWFYSITSGYAEFTPDGDPNELIYTVTYTTGYDSLPNDLRQAILAEASHIFKLRGSPITDVVSPNAALLCAHRSRNLIIS